LNKSSILQFANLSGVFLRTVPKHKNCGDAFYRAQDGPVRLAGFGERAPDDVVKLFRERVLGNGTAAA
jgi:hypothetical protein